MRSRSCSVPSPVPDQIAERYRLTANPYSFWCRAMSALFMRKMKKTSAISNQRMMLASLKGQPLSSGFWKRSTLSTLRRARNATVATNASTDKTSMKLMTKV